MMIIRRKIQDRRLDKIKKQLLELGMNPSTDGMLFWTIAIDFARKDKNLAVKMTEMYRKVAKHCRTDLGKVERNMRTSLGPIKEKVQEKYKYNGKIDNKTFLSLCNYLDCEVK